MRSDKEVEYVEIPEDRLVTTTWHDDEDLEEVFWFAKHGAAHPALQFPRAAILHVSRQAKEEAMRELYVQA